MNKSRNQKSSSIAKISQKSRSLSSNNNSKSEYNEINSSSSEEFNKADENNSENNSENYIDEDEQNDSEEIDQQLENVTQRLRNKEKKIVTQTDVINSKKEKEKYDKKIMENDFKDYFDSNKVDHEDYYEVNYPELSKYEIKIDLYSELFKTIGKNNFFHDMQKNENLNIINSGNLYQLIYELFYQNYNVFLYGFGNKTKLVYDFITYYDEKYDNDFKVPYYIISCNLNNPEMNMKVIISNVESIIMYEFEKIFKTKDSEKQFKSPKNIREQIEKLEKINRQIRSKILEKGKINNEENEENSENLEKYQKKSRSESKASIIKKRKTKNINEDINNDINIDNENKNDTKLSKEEKEKMKQKRKEEEEKIENYFPYKILLIVHNLGSAIGRSQVFQNQLSELVKKLKFINLLATCENLTIPFYWTSEIKDKYRFCFLKYDTYIPYDIEIDESNSITGENGLKTGVGLREMFISFSDKQKKLIMEIAKLQLKSQWDKLTPKGLVDYFVNSGIGVVTDIKKLEELLGDPIEHEIVLLKLNNEINKETYRINYDKETVDKISRGEYFEKAVQ